MWAEQKNFVDICEYTPAPEGAIVKCIQRLDLLLKDIKRASRVIGNQLLSKKVEDASQAIRRDIVFAASLYFE